MGEFHKQVKLNSSVSKVPKEPAGQQPANFVRPSLSYEVFVGKPRGIGEKEDDEKKEYFFFF
jgi:hypothetical protein